MGCSGSKTPEDFLVPQSVHPDHVLIEGALSPNVHIELHSRVAKDTGLTTMLPSPKKPKVKIYEKAEGGILLQTASDLSTLTATFFDAAGKPAAVLVGNKNKTSNSGMAHLSSHRAVSAGTDDSRSVLYAREAPVLPTPYQISDMVAGQVFRKVDQTQTMEDGTVMHAVGIIRRVYTGDGAPLGLYRVDPEAGQFKTGDAEMQFAGQWNITDIVNGKKEPIAYNGFGSKNKIFVAAGVDAVLAVAIFEAEKLNAMSSVSGAVAY